MATEMERKLRAALEAGDSEELQRLCGEIDSNIELEVGGFDTQDYPFEELRKMPLAHHVACKPVSSSCLELLIDRFGPGCLTHRNDRGQTPVHLAAQHQDESWMKLVKEKGGKRCLRIVDRWRQTVVHFAAMNRKSNSCLKWLVKKLGSDCLTVSDRDGDTAVHLAALYQSIESLEWIKRQIGTDCFRLKVDSDRTAFHIAAWKSDNSNLKWLVKELGSDCLTVPDKYGDTAVHWAAEHQPVDSLQFIFERIGAEMFSLKNNQGEAMTDAVESWRWVTDKSAKRAWISSSLWRLKASRPPAGSSTPTAASAGTKKQLDPSFTDWDFILQEDKKQLIGRGGFGEVYKALTDRNQTVAVKMLPLSGTDKSGKLQKAVEMEKRGVEILKRLSHPNILQFLKCEQKSDGLYIFTELVLGHSLFELMQRQNKPFKESEVRDFSRQICLGLNFLHCQPQGAILHRDIKSENVMLTNEGVIKLIDFGLAREIFNTCSLSAGNQPKGTWHFMAPEMLMGEGNSIPQDRRVGLRLHVWAFGCVYELTAMQPPDGNEPQQRIVILRYMQRAMPDGNEPQQIADGFSAGLKDFYL
uniref:Protein kinase domain-containing protein n=1 Tax=Macrostomum lignano TaxID=282301 RepID=A0A1I8I8C8_9PLAT